MTAKDKLTTFIQSAFGSDELRIFINNTFPEHNIVHGLPGPIASHSQLVSQTVELLSRQGLINQRLLLALAAARPTKFEDLVSVNLEPDPLWFRKPSSSVTPDPVGTVTGDLIATVNEIHQRTWFRQQLLERHLSNLSDALAEVARQPITAANLAPYLRQVRRALASAGNDVLIAALCGRKPGVGERYYNAFFEALRGKCSEKHPNIRMSRLFIPTGFNQQLDDFQADGVRSHLKNVDCGALPIFVDAKTRDQLIESLCELRGVLLANREDYGFGFVIICSSTGCWAVTHAQWVSDTFAHYVWREPENIAVIIDLFLSITKHACAFPREQDPTNFSCDLRKGRPVEEVDGWVEYRRSLIRYSRLLRTEPFQADFRE